MPRAPGRDAWRFTGGKRCLRPGSGADVAGDGVAGSAGGARDGGPAAGRVDVAVVDDHPIILDGITRWVTVPGSGITVVATAPTVDAVLAGPGRRAHVVLLDLD